MKILVVHNYYQQYGGEDVVVESEVASLRRAGHEVVTYFVHNDDIRTVRDKINAAVSLFRNAAAKRHMRELLRAERPDVVHAHNLFPQLSPSVLAAAREANVPTIMTLHNFRLFCPTGVLFLDGVVCTRSIGHSVWWAVRKRVYRNSLAGTFVVALSIEWHKLMRTWLRNVTHFVALTDFAKATFIKAGIPGELIEVKPNAAEARAELAAPAARNGGLYVGRLSPEKGIDVLTAAWQSLEVPLRVAGAGPMAPLVEARKTENVTILGRLPKAAIEEEMDRAAFLILPSVCYEMFPVALAEAYSAALPVIASRLGGFPDLIEEGERGMLFDAGNPSDLQRAVRWAAANPQRMAQMGQNALRYFHERFEAPRNAQTLVRIYERAIAAAASR